MSLDAILLALVNRPASGYELKRVLRESIGHFWSADLGQLYRTLQRLERQKLLTSQILPSNKGPARRVYRRTAAGRRKLLEWLRSGPQTGAERFAYIAQLVFLYEVNDLNETRQFLDELREVFRRKLKLYQEMDAAEARRGTERLSGSDFHAYLGLRMAIHSLSAKVHWCDEAIDMILARIDRESKNAGA
jgi:DNA-binding PadR family transcriptional regulator